MNNLDLQEAPFLPVNPLGIITKPIDQKGKRLKIAAGIIGAMALLAFVLQFYGILSQQKTDLAAMGDKIQQLEQNNLDLKKLIEDQANSSKFISSELDSTKTRFEGTRQDLVDTQTKLDSVQKEFAETKSTLDSMKKELQDSRREMIVWKQEYASAMAVFTKKDEEYRKDITVILQKIQSLDIGSINDKIYELQMSLMNVEKKLIRPDQSPFDDNSSNTSAIMEITAWVPIFEAPAPA